MISTLIGIYYQRQINMENNILVSELKATLARLEIIKNNISDDFTKQISKDVIQYMTPLVKDVEEAYKNKNDSSDKQ